MAAVPTTGGSGQTAVAVAAAADSLEPATISARAGTPLVNNRPTGTLVAPWTVTEAVPSGVPAGTSKYSRLPLTADSIGRPSASTTRTPIATAAASGTTDTLRAPVRTVTGPSRVPTAPDTPPGSSPSEAGGSGSCPACRCR